VRRPRPLVALLSLQVASGCLTAPLLSQLPVYVDILRLPPLFTASLQSAQMLLGAAASILGGLLTDAIGVRRTVLIGLTAALLLALLFLSESPALMLVLAFGGGAALGTFYVAGQAYLLAASPLRRIGLGAAVFFLGNTLGSAAGNFIAGRLLQSWGFGVVMGGIAALAALLIGAGVLLLPDIARPAVRERRHAVLSGYVNLLGRRPVALLCGVRYLATWYWGAVTLLLPLLVHRESGSVAVAGGYAALSLAVAAPCSLVSGAVWDRHRPRWLVPGLIGAIALDCVLLARLASSLPGLFIAGTAGAALAWSLSALMPGLIGSLTGPSERGRGVGLLQTAWSLGMLSGALAGGALVAITPSLPFIAITAPVLAAFTLSLVLTAVSRQGAQLGAGFAAASRETAGFVDSGCETGPPHQ
jgi:MFS family permease